jgi:hypothetical protein
MATILLQGTLHQAFQNSEGEVTRWPRHMPKHIQYDDEEHRNHDQRVAVLKGMVVELLFRRHVVNTNIARVAGVSYLC